MKNDGKRLTFKFASGEERCSSEILSTVRSTYISGSRLDSKKTAKFGSIKVKLVEILAQLEPQNRCLGRDDFFLGLERSKIVVLRFFGRHC